MAVTLRAVSTAVPPTVLVQEEVRDVFAAQPGLNRLAQRIIGTAFDVSGIATRHTVLEELSWEARPDEPVFFDIESGELRLPGTKARNEIYAVEATQPLPRGRAGARSRRAPGVEASDITHVVTVSCTGFYAPGPDFMLVRDLGLDAGRRALPPGLHGLLRGDSGAAHREAVRARPMPRRSCSSSAPSCARCTCARRTTPTRSSRRRCSPTARPRAS